MEEQGGNHCPWNWSTFSAQNSLVFLRLVEF